MASAFPFLFTGRLLPSIIPPLFFFLLSEPLPYNSVRGLAPDHSFLALDFFSGRALFVVSEGFLKTSFFDFTGAGRVASYKHSLVGLNFILRLGLESLGSTIIIRRGLRPLLVAELILLDITHESYGGFSFF